MRAPLSAEWVHLARGPRGYRVGATSRSFARQRDARLFYIWYMARPFEWCRTRSGAVTQDRTRAQSRECTDIIADRRMHLRSRLGHAIVIRIYIGRERQNSIFHMDMLSFIHTPHNDTGEHTGPHATSTSRSTHAARDREGATTFGRRAPMLPSASQIKHS